MTDYELMKEALSLAAISADEGEVPVGAVISRFGEIIAVGRNKREYGKNALYHAEVEAIDEACKKLGGWRLVDCELFVTLEPCVMCAGAIINSRIIRVVFGAHDKKSGVFGSMMDLNNFPFNHKPIIEGGFMEEECSAMLSDFFKYLRNTKQKGNE